MVPDCPSCGLHFEREPGYFAGALAINIMAVGALFAVVFVALLVATVPDVPVVELLDRARSRSCCSGRSSSTRSRRRSGSRSTARSSSASTRNERID